MRRKTKENICFATGACLVLGSVLCQVFVERSVALRILLIACAVGAMLISHAWKMRWDRCWVAPKRFDPWKAVRQPARG